MKRWKAVLLTGILLGSMAVGGCGAAKGVKGNDAKEEITTKGGSTVTITSSNKKKADLKYAPKDPISTEKTENVIRKQNNGVLTEVISTKGEDDNSITYDKYAVSTIDLKKQTDATTDKKDDPSKDGVSSDFASLFGFDYKTCKDGLDLYQKALSACGFDFSNATYHLDKEVYQNMDGIDYTVDNAGDAANRIMKGISYDKIDKQFVTVNASQNQDMVVHPDFISATTIYEKDGKKYTRSISLSYAENESGCSCGCGHKDESECNDSCGHDKKAKTDSCKDSMTCK